MAANRSLISSSVMLASSGSIALIASTMGFIRLKSRSCLVPMTKLMAFSTRFILLPCLSITIAGGRRPIPASCNGEGRVVHPARYFNHRRGAASDWRPIEKTAPARCACGRRFLDRAEPKSDPGCNTVDPPTSRRRGPRSGGAIRWNDRYFRRSRSDRPGGSRHRVPPSSPGGGRRGS